MLPDCGVWPDCGFAIASVGASEIAPTAIRVTVNRIISLLLTPASLCVCRHFRFNRSGPVGRPVLGRAQSGVSRGPLARAMPLIHIVEFTGTIAGGMALTLRQS